MIRILHVIDKMDCGGTETMIMNIYRKIDRTKVQFDFLVHNHNKGFYDEEIKKLGGQIYYIKKFKGKNIISYIRNLKKFFLNHSEDIIVHGHLGSSAAIYLYVAKKYGRYTIAHSHNTRNPKKSIKNYIWLFFSFFTRYVADFYFACSKKAGIDRFGKKIVSSENFLVINNAIDTTKYVYSEYKRQAMRKKMNIENQLIIGNIGRFSRQKNHKFMIDVFKEIKKIREDAKLVLVGDGKLKRKIEKKVKEEKLEKDVIFTGVIDYIPDILQAFDIFLFPSFYEGLGIVAIEAQASGLITVCADSIPEETEVTKLVRKISLKKSAQFWAKIINENIDYDRKNMYEEIVKAQYDISSAYKIIEEFYLKKAENIKVQKKESK